MEKPTQSRISASIPEYTTFTNDIRVDREKEAREEDECRVRAFAEHTVPRKALRGGISKSILQRPCHLWR